MLPAKQRHIAAKIKRMVFSVEFFSLLFSAILGKGNSREDLENTPSGERAEVHKLFLVWVPRKDS